MRAVSGPVRRDGSMTGPSPLGARPQDPVDRETILADVKSGLFGDPVEPISLGRYAILGTLGSGGGGVVYLAYDPELDRRVALKLVHATGEDPRDRLQLLREAQAMARLSHPNVAAVHDVGTFGADQLPAGVPKDGSPGVFLVMEYVPGDDLHDWLAQRDRTWRERLDALIEAGRGLARAHAQGIVHRDFKPSNVRVGRDGRVRVIDFGLAIATATQQRYSNHNTPLPRRGPTLVDARDARVSAPRTIAGTPRYMAPEQFASPGGTTHSDQYAYCAVLFEALYGEPAFPQDGAADLEGAKRRRALPTVGASHVPRWIRRTLLRGLEPDPAHRFSTMEALLDALQRDPVRRYRTPVLAGLGLALAAGTLATQVQDRAQQTNTCEREAGVVETVWSSQKSSVLRDTLAGQGDTLTLEAWPSLQTALDRYTHEWRSLRVETCSRATLDHDLTVAQAAAVNHCLDSRLQAADGMVRSLYRADPSTLYPAISAVASLAPIETCRHAADGVATTPDHGVAPLSSDAQAQVRALLSESRALQTMGDVERALAVALAAVERCDAPQTRALLPQALRRQATVLTGSDRRHDAKPLLQRALVTAERAGDVEQVVRTMLFLLEFAIWEEGDLQAAERWQDRTEARIQGSGAYVPLEVLLALQTITAELRERQGRFADAQRHLRTALGLASEIYGEHSLQVSDVHHDLAVLADRTGQWRQSAREFARVRNVRASALGERHPDTLLARANAALPLRWLGDVERSLSEVDAALAGMEAAVGPDHLRLAWFHQARGLILADMDRFRESLTAFERALVIRRNNLPAHHGSITSSRIQVAEALNDVGHFDLARAAIGDALDDWRGAPDHPWLIGARVALGVSLRMEGDLDRAAGLHLATLEAARHADHANDVTLATVAWLAGDTLLLAGRTGDATTLLEEALLAQQNAGFTDYALAPRRFSLARAIQDTDPGRARALAEAALSGFGRVASTRRSSDRVRRWLRSHHPGTDTNG